MNVVIVESAAKAQTINKYLGRDFNENDLSGGPLTVGIRRG